EKSLLEVHVIDFDGDLYGCEMLVEFVDFLRSERKFEGMEHLSEQLAVDVADARKRLGLS
ncbi:MAG: bifunctional riboflavin kinase/FAD synthetase, partial [Acidimicrobiaceae bacterium]|nr:bifunctional riboflavin kinase/FAD synthetase [Acidimicrobiaceae bacterium]